MIPLVRKKGAASILLLVSMWSRFFQKRCAHIQMLQINQSSNLLRLQPILNQSINQCMCWLSRLSTLFCSLFFQLALYILDKLEAKDLLNVSKTCRKWRILAEDDVLWRTKSRRFGFHDERSVFRCPVSLDGFQRSLWKLNFIRQERILQNWRNGSGRLPRVSKNEKRPG